MATTQPLLGSGINYDVQTGINPATPYSPQNIADANSQIYAQAFQAASPTYLMDQDYNPGTGTVPGASAEALMAPQIAGILSGANSQVAANTMNTAGANANALLGMQQDQAGTALSLAGLGSNQQNMLFGQGLQNLGYGQQVLGQLFGGGGTLLGGLTNMGGF